jgi:predicted nuclease with TOPRIM domain
MVTEKENLENRLSEATEALETMSAESEHFRNALDASRAAQEKLVEDVKQLTREREEERSRNRTLQQQLDENQRRLELLYEEVETLREELRQAVTVAASSSGDNAEKESRPAWTHPSRTSDEIPDRMDAEGTIAMLEGELRDANRAIKELKDALKNAIAEQGSNGYGHNMEAPSSMARHHVDSRAALSSGPAGNESTPLFYAMEKQAELNTARDEINRLANLLGDAESSKMEAYEAMEEMRRRMEEAEARLNRQEKFEGTKAKPTASATHDADGNANLEYLKNIMLSYLNAKTLSEKKALVPVIAAVLCLTPEEQAAAVKNLEESGGIESVGKALFETFGGSMRR